MHNFCNEKCCNNKENAAYITGIDSIDFWLKLNDLTWKHVPVLVDTPFLENQKIISCEWNRFYLVGETIYTTKEENLTLFLKRKRRAKIMKINKKYEGEINLLFKKYMSETAMYSKSFYRNDRGKPMYGKVEDVHVPDFFLNLFTKNSSVKDEGKVYL